jgi:hypothetical protein
MPAKKSDGTWQQRNRDAFNALWRRWYHDNAARKMGWQRRRLLEMRAWWRALKATKRCEECGESDPACLHFHHVDPTTKRFDIGEAASLGRSKQVILDELAKCRALCANCHLKHHWNERKGSG